MITRTPYEDQALRETWKETKEEKAVFLVPATPTSGQKNRARKPAVFYNPRMTLNRDLAVLFLKSWQQNKTHPIRIADPFAGCGVRSIRFALEVSDIAEIVAGDISGNAITLLKRNIARNNLSRLISVEHSSANVLLSKHSNPKTRFDFIDVDPFGSPAVFLDPAISALRNRGVLALTATDMAPLCGVHVNSCIRRYSSKPIRTEYVHELALRILIGSVIFAGAKHDIALKPLFSHSTDHYVRTYLCTERGAKHANNAINGIGSWGHCQNCLHREPLPGPFLQFNKTCSRCGAKWLTAGPLWLGGLFDETTCRDMIQLLSPIGDKLKIREAKLLGLIAAEIDAPSGYYVLSVLADYLGTRVPPMEDFFNKISEAGFTVCRTHFHPQGFKTDAPLPLLKETLKNF